MEKYPDATYWKFLRDSFTLSSEVSLNIEKGILGTFFECILLTCTYSSPVDVHRFEENRLFLYNNR